MNPEGEREDLETAAEASSAVISWDEGRRVVELGFLAEGLRACKDCSNPLELANTLTEKRYKLQLWTTEHNFYRKITSIS